MNVGLPGTGIGGVFYLLLALCMPFFELYKTLRGESSAMRWLFVLRQLLMSGAILVGMWGVGLALGLLINAPSGADPDEIGQFVQQVSASSMMKLNLFHIAPIVFSLLTLALIFLLTRLMGFAFRASESH